VNEIKAEKPLDGSTTIAPDSQPSSQNMKDGEEPENMLLALLWSPTETLISRKRALLATANYHGQKSTIIILVGAEFTENGLKFVGNLDVVGSANKDEARHDP
jgi:hypothetical protein